MTGSRHKSPFGFTPIAPQPEGLDQVVVPEGFEWSTIISWGDPILAEALTQLARAQALQRRFADADRSLDEAEAALRPDDGRWCVARCLRSLGRTEEALAEQRALAAELEAIGESDEFVTLEIAECLRALSRA